MKMKKLHKLCIATSAAVLGAVFPAVSANAVRFPSSGVRSSVGVGTSLGYNGGPSNLRSYTNSGGSFRQVNFVSTDGPTGLGNTPAGVLLSLRGSLSGNKGPTVLTGSGSPGIVFHQGPYFPSKSN